MGALDIGLAILAILLPLVVLDPFTDRPSRKKRRALWIPGIATFLFGVVAFVISALVQWAVMAFLGVSVPREGRLDIVSIAYAFLVIGPMDETLRAAAIVPMLRSKRLRRPYDAMRLAIASAAGFVTAHNVVRLMGHSLTLLDLTRTGLSLAAHVGLTALWGFSLGRDRRRRVGGAGWNRTFLAAVVFSSLTSHLLFDRGPSALWGAVPLTLLAVLVALIARRDLLRLSEAPKKTRSTGFISVSPPSLEALRASLRRPEQRPVLLRWIIFGAFVTTGVLTAMIAGSVALGHEAGIDFAIVDEAGAFERSAGPLVLLGTGALGAFPVSGFLVARASAARGVLEPALGASVAILGIVVLVGLAAPVAVVFGLALAPVAFALACAGAWVGLER